MAQLTEYECDSCHETARTALDKLPRGWRVLRYDSDGAAHACGVDCARAWLKSQPSAGDASGDC